MRRQGRDPQQARFVSSPLWRACETMQRVRAALGLPPGNHAVDPRLAELAFGAWEGCTWPELKAAVPLLVKARKRDKWAFVPPGGESYADLALRLRPWLDTVADGDVVVAHGGVARVLLHMLAGVARADAPQREIVQGRVLWFRRGRAEWI